MAWLDLLPKTKAAMSPDKWPRVEYALSHQTEVILHGNDGFLLSDWDEYLAENHEMFVPYTYTDESDNEFNVVACQVFFDGNQIKQYLHLTTKAGEQAGMIIFEGSKDDGKESEEAQQEIQPKQKTAAADAVCDGPSDGGGV